MEQNIFKGCRNAFPRFLRNGAHDNICELPCMFQARVLPRWSYRLRDHSIVLVQEANAAIALASKHLTSEDVPHFLKLLFIPSSSRKVSPCGAKTPVTLGHEKLSLWKEISSMLLGCKLNTTLTPHPFDRSPAFTRTRLDTHSVLSRRECNSNSMLLRRRLEINLTWCRHQNDIGLSSIDGLNERAVPPESTFYQYSP